MSSQITDPDLAQQYLAEITPVREERENARVAFVSLLRELVATDLTEGYPAEIKLPGDDSPYELRAVCVREDTNFNETFVYGTLERARRLEDDIPARVLTKFIKDGNKGLHLQNFFSLAGYELYFEKGGHCTECIYAIGEENEILVGTFIPLDRLSQASGGDITEAMLLAKLDQLNKLSETNNHGIFEFGGKEKPKEHKQVSAQELVNEYTKRFLEVLNNPQRFSPHGSNKDTVQLKIYNDRYICEFVTCPEDISCTRGVLGSYVTDADLYNLFTAIKNMRNEKNEMMSNQLYVLKGREGRLLTCVFIDMKDRKDEENLLKGYNLILSRLKESKSQVLRDPND